MTAQTLATAPQTRAAASPSGTARQVWKTGAIAGVGASVATFAFAAAARGIDVPLTVSGKSIPIVGFAQLTFVAAIIGTIIAVTSLRAHRAHRMFLTVTFALTAVSFVPDLLADAHTATKVALMLSHVIAAAIVVPALASRLSD